MLGNLGLPAEFATHSQIRGLSGAQGIGAASAFGDGSMRICLGEAAACKLPALSVLLAHSATLLC